MLSQKTIRWVVPPAESGVPGSAFSFLQMLDQSGSALYDGRGRKARNNKTYLALTGLSSNILAAQRALQPDEGNHVDDRRFDSLIRSLGAGASRRSVFKGLLGLGGAVAGGIMLDERGEAARRPAPAPKPVSCPGRQVSTNGQCACPPATPHKCGPDCCTGTSNDPYPRPPTHTECCDNACCDGSCYGEELCCPTNPRAGEMPPTHQLCQSADYGIECCPYDHDCCSVDGCCATDCYGGSDGASFCCPAADICRGGSQTADSCCTGTTSCCGDGTNDNVCLDLSEDGACCSVSNCPPNNTCEHNRCVPPPCNPECDSTQTCIDNECLCKPGFKTGDPCAPCEPGSYSDTSGASSCATCELNSYQDQSGQTSCLPCAEGYYTEDTGATVCLECNCALGTMPSICGCGSSLCSPGYAPNNGMCMPCAVGSASLDGTTCVACPPGSFAANVGQITCDPCAIGSYADTIGSAVCTACPAGSYQSALGQASCISCGVGTYTDTTGNYACLNCPPGAYAAALGSTQCTSCAAGTYNNIAANYTCYSCPVGAYSDTGADECTLCAVGTYNDTVGSAVCTECDAGYYANAPGTTQCTPCAAGSFASNTGSFSCTSCFIGTYAANPGSAQCTACSAGSYTNQTGSAACLLCDCGAACSPTTGTCGTTGINGECSVDSDCASGICGCGAPSPFPDCICRNDPCFAQGEDCSSGFGAAWCCAGDCSGNWDDGFFCTGG